MQRSARCSFFFFLAALVHAQEEEVVRIPIEVKSMKPGKKTPIQTVFFESRASSAVEDARSFCNNTMNAGDDEEELDECTQMLLRRRHQKRNEDEQEARGSSLPALSFQVRAHPCCWWLLVRVRASLTVCRACACALQMAKGEQTLHFTHTLGEDLAAEIHEFCQRNFPESPGCAELVREGARAKAGRMLKGIDE